MGQQDAAGAIKAAFEGMANGFNDAARVRAEGQAVKYLNTGEGPKQLSPSEKQMALRALDAVANRAVVSNLLGQPLAGGIDPQSKILQGEISRRMANMAQMISTEGNPIDGLLTRNQESASSAGMKKGMEYASRFLKGESDIKMADIPAFAQGVISTVVEQAVELANPLAAIPKVESGS